MAHDHQHTPLGHIGNAFKAGIALNVIFIVLEVIYGFLSNSMALVSDAGHNFSDVVALVFSWIAILLSERKPTMKFTYGLRRSTILAALFNTILLLVAVAFLLYETIDRIGSTDVIKSGNIIIISSAGIIINGLTAWLFMKGKKHDLNIRSAFVHFLADTLVSAGVLLAGIIMFFTAIWWIDTVVSFIIIVVILYSSYRLLIDSVSLALDAVPENIDIRAVRKYLGSIKGVDGVHDLHIWALSTSAAALTVHLVTDIRTDVSFISGIQQALLDKYGIEHSTIQVEFGGKSEPCSGYR
ncbi:MAG TPA: cation diffusion facilitator family transporter [Bacteroidales bacterium]|nr:cation diffusion facilitator family transporter [Bacteroidales bacterium]